jgi:hypothetical protein
MFSDCQCRRQKDRSKELCHWDSSYSRSFEDTGDKGGWRRIEIGGSESRQYACWEDLGCINFGIEFTWNAKTGLQLLHRRTYIHT